MNLWAESCPERFEGPEPILQATVIAERKKAGILLITAALLLVTGGKPEGAKSYLLSGRSKPLKHFGQSFIDLLSVLLWVVRYSVRTRATPEKLLRFSIGDVNYELTSNDRVDLSGAHSTHSSEPSPAVAPNIDWSKYHTYAWHEGTPAKDPLMAQRIVAGIDAQLTAKGLTKATADPDLVVMYHVATD